MLSHEWDTTAHMDSDEGTGPVTPARHDAPLPAERASGEEEQNVCEQCEKFRVLVVDLTTRMEAVAALADLSDVEIPSTPEAGSPSAG